MPGHVVASLLIFLSVVGFPGLASAQTPLQAETKAKWGILADLAGRDFANDCQGCDSHLIMFFRWSHVDEEISLVSTGSWSSSSKSIISLSTGDTLSQVTDSGPTKNTPMRLTLEADGSILFPVFQNRQTRMRFSVGRISIDVRHAASNQWKEVSGYIEVSSANAKTKETAEKRRLKFGVVAPITTLYASAPPNIQASVVKNQVAVTTSAHPEVGTTAAATSGITGPRFALVIGNGEYANALGSLKNPANDARMVAAELKASGFQVELVTNADQRTMKQAISRLGERMARGGRGSTGLFYFAGHGMQSRGINYLIPTSAMIKREADVDLEAVSADTVLLQMEEADAGTNIIILDACRNTPVLRSFRSGTRGLAQMEAPNGSFISYSTAPGSVAADGAGDYSPFATALARQLRQKGLPIEITFRNVRREVLKLTEGQQTPWDSSSLIDTFMFNPG